MVNELSLSIHQPSFANNELMLNFLLLTVESHYTHGPHQINYKSVGHLPYKVLFLVDSVWYTVRTVTTYCLSVLVLLYAIDSGFIDVRNVCKFVRYTE